MKQKILGQGLNETFTGFETFSERLMIDSLPLINIPTGIIHSPTLNTASIGMGILKDYSLV